MKRSSANVKTKIARARNAALLNLLATPGLGSLMAGRWFAGVGQLLLALLGFALILVWFLKNIVPYYGQMFSDHPAPHVNWKIGIDGAIIFIGSWIWSLVTSLSLMREAAHEKNSTMETFTAPVLKLDEAKIISALVELPDWKRAGEKISRTYEFKDFPGAMKFVNAIAKLAETAQHHPDIDLRWNQVTLGLTTHDAGGLTQKDFALAKQCDALAKS
jgi:4a-hydroxytetrahydrobiopterin dehydratase